ncbi:hypothetical protein [Aurantiacibacter marinus]|uniref:hypothetical protein n=1 Tax=Aurantiacibacter marinus TaxID=874156 RepID=UPI0012E0962D
MDDDDLVAPATKEIAILDLMTPDKVIGSHGAARNRRKALFVIFALAGLGLTTGIVWAGEVSVFDPRTAKLFAIAVSFSVTWLLRSRVVFR